MNFSKDTQAFSFANPEPQQIVADDDDFDDDGMLREERQDVYEDRYEELDYIELDTEEYEDEYVDGICLALSIRCWLIANG